MKLLRCIKYDIEDTYINILVFVIVLRSKGFTLSGRTIGVQNRPVYSTLI